MLHIENVVGGDHGYIEVACQLDQDRYGETVALVVGGDFDEEVAFSKCGEKHPGRPRGMFELALHDQRVDPAMLAAGEGHQSAIVPAR